VWPAVVAPEQEKEQKEEHHEDADHQRDQAGESGQVDTCATR
jgi:hypothetical protein